MSVDSSVPTSAAHTVMYIVSPLGQAPIGSSVEIPPLDPGAETILLASDGNNNIILAAMYSSGGANKSFTSTSTAVGISRLIQGALPTGVTDAQMDSAIQTTAEFPNLVSLINKALAAGVAPANYSGVPLSVTTVLGEALSTINPNTASISAHVASSLANPTVTYPGAYTVLQSTPIGYFSIKVTGPDSNVSGVDVANGFPIQFAAYGAKADGSGAIIPPVIVNSSSEEIGSDGFIQMPLSGILSQPRVTPVTGNGEEWNLTILQTPASRSANGQKLVSDFMDTTLSLLQLGALKGDCTTSIASDIWSSSALQTWADQPSGQSAWNDLIDVLSTGGTWTAIGQTAHDCALSALPTLSSSTQQKVNSVFADFNQSSFAQKIAPMMNRLKPLLDTFNKATTVYDVADLGTEAWADWNYWNSSTTVGVCETTSAVTQLANCAASLKLNSNSGSLIAGGTTAFTVSALDSNNNPTLTPQNLVWSSSNSSVASVDPVTGVVTALNPSATPVTIQVTDPISGATGTVTVTVSGVSDSISATPSSITSGGTATLNWSSTNATSCTASGAWSGPQSTSGTLQVTPSSPGVYNYGLSCAGPGGPATSSSALTVVGSGTLTYNYVGASFDNQAGSDNPMMNGHVTATVTFQNIPNNYSGSVGIANVSSFMLSVNNPLYPNLTYPNINTCSYEANFIFANGKIVSWVLNIYSSNNNCSDTQVSGIEILTASNNTLTGGDYDVGDYNANLPAVIGGTDNGPGTWTQQVGG